jgi:hypothetical protein
VVLDPGNALQSVAFRTNVDSRPTAGNAFSFVIDATDSAANKIMSSCTRCSGYIVDMEYVGLSAPAECDACKQRLLPVFQHGLASGNVSLQLNGPWKFAIYLTNYVTRVAMHIQGSPMILQVTANVASPANCIASGGGLVGTSVKREGIVIITARDAWNNERLSLDVPADNVIMSLFGK